MRIALYARVSKPPNKGALNEQQKRDQNPEVQLLPLREWARSQKHIIVDEYVDRLTGKTRRRPQLERLMQESTKGLREIDAVVVWKLDRFGRSNRDLHNLIAELQEAKIGFISLKENFDLTTPLGRALFGMLAVMAEFERDCIAERTKAGLAYARSQGRVPGRKIDPRTGPSRTTLWRQKQRKVA